MDTTISFILICLFISVSSGNNKTTTKISTTTELTTLEPVEDLDTAATTFRDTVNSTDASSESTENSTQALNETVTDLEYEDQSDDVTDAQPTTSPPSSTERSTEPEQQTPTFKPTSEVCPKLLNVTKPNKSHINWTTDRGNAEILYTLVINNQTKFINISQQSYWIDEEIEGYCVILNWKHCTDTQCSEAKPSTSTGLEVTMGFVTVVLLLVIIFIIIKTRRRFMNIWYTRIRNRPGNNIRLNNLTKASTLRPHYNRPVGISQFEAHFNSMSADSKLRFSMEFEELNASSCIRSCKAALIPENQGKNRWSNILPFDHSRVKLLPIADDVSSDYINANYIPGFKSQREYICTQGPLPNTVDDFWRMVWEQGSTMIVMLTQCVERGKVKCEPYWPSDSETQCYGDIAISLTSEIVFPEYTIRTFDLQLGSRVMEVKQTHFTMWPDFGCPDSTQLLLDFIRNVRNHMSRTYPAGPTIVHCSAGVGRTGTFIAVERLMRHALDFELIDVYHVVSEMRRYRNYMVQTEDQYVYIHECLRDYLRSMNDAPSELSATESQLFLTKLDSTP